MYYLKCQADVMPSPAPGSTPDRILDSSLSVFCRYGFRKTSMQDIADAANMSRAALYLHFKNKEDVFRSGSIRAHERVMDEVRTRLGGSGAVLSRIESALLAFFGGLMRDISESPHGFEIFDASAELIGDVASSARQELLSLIAEALRAAEEVGEVDLGGAGTTAEELAALLVASVDGLKLDRQSLLSVDSGIALQLRLTRSAVAD